MKNIKTYKLFENIEEWNEFHSLKSQNPKNPQMIYDREPEKNILNKLLYDLNEGSRILDLGCGDGVDSMYMSSKGFNVSGLDISPVIINENKQKDDNIDWKIYNIGDANLPYKNDEFDLIYCRLSLHYFDKETLNAIFYDIRKKLKSGGLLYFTVKTQDLKEKIKTGKKYLHRVEWERLLSFYFSGINIMEHTGKLYNIPSRWLEIECI